MEQNENPFDNVNWKNGYELTIDGQGWSGEELESPYDRFPAKAKDEVDSKIWNHAKSPAGISIRFETDAPSLYFRWTLEGEDLNSIPPHCNKVMTAGLDCYGRNNNGVWVWTGCTSPWRWPNPDCRLAGNGLDEGWREYRLYLPLQRRVKSLEIGVKNKFKLQPARPDTRKPIISYGTSIVHGVAASRPGMPHVAQLSRWWDYPWINLGFGGAGWMDQPVASLLSELDPYIYIVDCLPNLSEIEIKASLPRFVEIIREKKPDTPIVFVPDRLFGDAGLIQARRDEQKNKNLALKQSYDSLLTHGVPEIYLLEGENYFGEDFDGTVDGSHPTDLGAFRMAQFMDRALLPWKGGLNLSR